MTGYPEIEPIWREFDDLNRELGSDILFFRRAKRHQGSQHWRRAYCRAVSAYLEAITSWMARYTITLYHPGQLGDDERKNLEARLPSIKRAFHALDLFTDTAGAESPLRQESEEWKCLDEMIKVRNRITHPKCASDVIVTDDDLTLVERAADILLYLFSESLRRCSRALSTRFKHFKQAVARNKPALAKKLSASGASMDQRVQGRS